MSSLSIFVVEDNILIAIQISRNLEHLGYTVSGLSSGDDETFSSIKSAHPDVVLMDIQLADNHDGVELAKQVYTQLDIPVIFLTASTDEATIQRASQSGSYGYLVKPFNQHELGTTIHIAHLKHTAEQKLRESEARYRALFEELTEAQAQILLQSTALNAAANAIFITDQAGEIVWINRAFTQLTGYSSSEAVGQNPRLLKSGYHEQAFYKDLWDTILSGEVWRGEIINRRKNSDLYHQEAVITPLMDNDGQPSHFIAIQQDITDRKRAETAERATYQQSTALHHALQAITSSLSLEKLLKTILQSLGKVLNYSAAFIWLTGDDKVQLGAYQGEIDTSTINAECIRAEHSLVHQICQNENPITYSLDAVDDDNRAEGSCWTMLSNFSVLLGIPLRVRGTAVGVLAVLFKDSTAFNNLQLMLAQNFGNQAAIAIENARLYEQERKAAITDPLTTLHNRRYFFEYARMELERANRGSAFPALIMADLDHFKQVNDQYGHLTGDRVLQEVALVILNTVRVMDLVARFGGEEFIILLPSAGLQTVIQVAERIRNRIQETKFATEDGQQIIHITISLGVAIPEENSNDLTELIRRADAALYRAKSSGRNCVQAAP